MCTENKTEQTNNMKLAKPIQTGIEDKFCYEITDACISCGACVNACPSAAISKKDGGYRINPQLCIDCGTCSVVCPTGAAQRYSAFRKSISIPDIDLNKCYFNPGCAMSLYKPELPQLMLSYLQEHFGNVKAHNICCRHAPCLEEGATIINNCAGCDRRFRSLYKGINTISVWEILDNLDNLKLPDYNGMTVSVHDSCGYRHKPQVHQAIRSLLHKMNIRIKETKFSGTESICCGDNLYGVVSNECVEQRIQSRADQFPCENVVVTCIGCIRAMTAGGKKPLYLPDLLFCQTASPMLDTLDEYHSKLENYVRTR